MVSKTRKQRQKTKAKLQANNGVLPPVIPAERKSIHLKKVRPNLKGKHKIRLGLESPDIYEGFDEKKGVLWKCQTCGRSSRVVGLCLTCQAGIQPKDHAGLNMNRDAAKKQIAKQVTDSKKSAGTAVLGSAAKKSKGVDAKKKLRFKKKR